jgi:hypothetical protein
MKQVDRTVIVSNRLSRKRGVIRTVARNVNDVARINNWRDRLFLSHIAIALKEEFDNV